MLLKKRRPASHLARTWILLSIGSTLRLGFFFFIHLEQINVTEEEKTSVALGQKMDLAFHRKYFAAWLLLLPGL
jgi:hypothetical protein